MSEQGGPSDSLGPASDRRAGYDYQADSVERPALRDALETRVDGDVRFDKYSRQLFATDASAYEALPIGVVAPRTPEDVSAVMRYCAGEGIPVLPRGGGTSLAGQAVNTAVVLDFKRHMNDVLAIDAEAARVRAQPGITLAELDAHLEPHGLKFAPDPAWGEKSVLGGAIGNNSTGSHSLKYGKTDAYIEECEVVLSDGTTTTFGWVPVEELHERATAAADQGSQIEAQIYAEVGRILHEDVEEIQENYPDLKRNVSGYNLDQLVADAQERGEVNLGRLLAGSEGTLAIVTAATVSLEPIPAASSVVMLTYADILDAMRDVAPILEHDPSAVEVMDDVFLDLARENPKYGELVETLPAGTDSTLLVEFYAEDSRTAKQKVAELLADRLPAYEPAVAPRQDHSGPASPTHAVDALEAYEEERQSKFWAMRKAGLPILLSRTGDEKHWHFVEDTAIPPENLPAYVADLQALFGSHDTFAAYYAHAGPGVLHIRPLLNLKSEDGVETMGALADAVSDLVIEYGGSVSGEHGDGRARTEWNEKLYGTDLWNTFRDLKSAFDPDWLLNPGSVCGDFEVTDALRYDSSYTFDAGFEPFLNWDNENGFQGMVELCHGCGGCTGYQDTTGDVMCPTYRATEEEMATTRGRANLLRAAMNGSMPGDPFSEEFRTEVMDLCIGCKGCLNDCPSGVDMAKLKAEIDHEAHDRHGISLRDRLFGNVERALWLGRLFAPLSNWALEIPGSRWVLERTLGIAAERDLPRFQRETFRDWMAERGGSRVPESEANGRVLLPADPYMNFTNPAVGQAAVRVLEAADVHVTVPETVTDSGRPAFSKGLLERARRTAAENVDTLVPAIEDGWELVTVEPSEAVMYQHDYLSLLSGETVNHLAANSYGLFEYLHSKDLIGNIGADPNPSEVAYHGHCHQQAHRKDHHAVAVLRQAGFSVDVLDSTCCGMAGSFGYEAEHHSMSMAIGSLLFEQVTQSSADTVVAPGASCRTQLGARPESDEPPHPVELLAGAL